MPRTAEHNSPGSSDRAFGLVFCAVFVVVGLWLLTTSKAPSWWAFALAAVFALLAVTRPRTLAPLNRVWAAFGLMLHKLISPLLMGVIFFGVVTPIGLFMRLIGKDVLKLRWRADVDSYWIERETPGPERAGMKKQF